MSKTALICAHGPGLVASLETSLGKAGYLVETVATPNDAINALKTAKRDAMVSEVSKHAFSSLARAAFQLDPEMPFHLICGTSVFCFYPFAVQPPELVAAIRDAGVTISDRLLRDAAGRGGGGDDAFLI